MQFVLIYPNMKGYCNGALASYVAAEAEQLGFNTFLVWDHYGLPIGPDTLDCWNLLAYVAGKTSTIKLGTCVTPIPFRPPAQLAKVVATVDVLSGGRVILGVGAGWHQPEFDSFSQWDPLKVRVDKTIEGLDLMIKLWTEDVVNFQGKYYQCTGDQVQISPKPVQKPHPPLWFGVKGKRMMHLAAKHGDGWIPGLITPREYQAGMDKLRAHRREMRIKKEMKGSIQIFNAPMDVLDPGGSVSYHNRCTDPAMYLKAVEDYAAAGCDYLGLVWSYPPDELLTRLRWFKKEVMAKI